MHEAKQGSKEGRKEGRKEGARGFFSGGIFYYRPI